MERWRKCLCSPTIFRLRIASVIKSCWSSPAKICISVILSVRVLSLSLANPAWCKMLTVLKCSHSEVLKDYWACDVNVNQVSKLANHVCKAGAQRLPIYRLCCCSTSGRKQQVKQRKTQSKCRARIPVCHWTAWDTEPLRSHELKISRNLPKLESNMILVGAWWSNGAWIAAAPPQTTATSAPCQGAPIDSHENDTTWNKNPIDPIDPIDPIVWATSDSKWQQRGLALIFLQSRWGLLGLGSHFLKRIVNYIAGRPKSLALHDVPSKHVPQHIGASPSSPMLYVATWWQRLSRLWHAIKYGHILIGKDLNCSGQTGCKPQEIGAILSHSDCDVRWAIGPQSWIICPKCWRNMEKHGETWRNMEKHGETMSVRSWGCKTSEGITRLVPPMP